MDDEERKDYSNNMSDNDKSDNDAIFGEEINLAQSNDELPRLNIKNKSTTTTRIMNSKLFGNKSMRYKSMTPNTRKNEKDYKGSDDDIEVTSTGGFYGPTHGKGVITEDDVSDRETPQQLLTAEEVKLPELDVALNVIREKANDNSFIMTKTETVTASEAQETSQQPDPSVPQKTISFGPASGSAALSFGAGSDRDNQEDQKDGMSSVTPYSEMKPAVDWLEYEPNFLYKEFATQ